MHALAKLILAISVSEPGFWEDAKALTLLISLSQLLLGEDSLPTMMPSARTLSSWLTQLKPVLLNSGGVLLAQ